MKKKFFSLLLVAAGLLFSGMAWATGLDYASDEEAVAAGAVCKIGTAYYNSLSLAYNDAQQSQSDGTIVMINNASETLSVNYDWQPTTCTNWTLDLNGFNVEQKTGRMNVRHGHFTITNSQENVAVYDLSTTSGLVAFGSTNPGDVNYVSITIDKRVRLVAGTYAFWISTNSKHAYGVTLTVKGEINCSGWGMYINGQNQDITGAVPVVNIEDGAVIRCTGASNNDGCVGIYAGGYAIWNIGNAEIYANVGIYIKGGKVNLNGTTIVAVGDYAAPVANGNGCSANGSAIVVDSHAGYVKDGMELSITGNTQISSTSGYGIEEIATKGSDKLPSVVIESGSIQGDLGAIVATDQEKQHIKDEGTITGGTYNSSIAEFISNIDGVITYTDDEKGETMWTVTPLEAGQSWNTDGVTGDHVKLEDKNIEVSTNTTAGYIVLMNNTTLTVKSGATYTVDELVIDADCKVVVEAGARLIVLGNNGIISTNVDNLVLEAAADGSFGEIFINPAVTFNTQPMATVMLKTISYANTASDYLYQRFALPTGYALEELEIEDDKEVYFTQYNLDTDSWESLGFLNNTGSHAALDLEAMNTPFRNYQFLVNNSTPGLMLTMKGKLVGNTNAEVNLKGHFWNGFGNSYVAKMDVETLLEELEDNFSGSQENIAIYVFTPMGGNQYKWSPITMDNIEDKEFLNPTEVFLIKNDGDATTLPINYNKLIWEKK